MCSSDLTKLQDACNHIARSISKSATTCGCISIDAHKQPYPATTEYSLEELQALFSTQVSGKLCPNCEEALEKEIGRTLFYLGALCNTFDLSLSEILKKEQYRTDLLGKYSLR